MENFLGVGFVFRPTDNELVRSYLLNKVTGKPLPCDSAVGICDLYGTMEPWEIWERFKRLSMDSDEGYLYFFTNLKKLKKGGERPRIYRRIGPNGGSWHEETVEKVLIVEGVRCSIRSFRYENKIVEAQHGRWLMKEYCLYDFKDSYVLCRLRKKKMKGSKAEGNLPYHLQDHNQPLTIGTESQDLCQYVSTTTLFDRNHMYESNLVPVRTRQNLTQNAHDDHQMHSSYHLQDQSGLAFHLQQSPAVSLPDNQMIGAGSQDLCQRISTTTLFDRNHMYQNDLISVKSVQNLSHNAPATINAMQIMSPLVGGGANSFGTDLFQFEGATREYAKLEGEMTIVPEVPEMGVPVGFDDHQTIGTGSQDLHQQVSTTTLFDQNHMYKIELIPVGTEQNLQQNVTATINSMQIIPPFVGGGANSFGTNLFQFEGATREYAELEGEMRKVPELLAVGAAIGDFGGHSHLHNQMHGGDSIQMAACHVHRGVSEPRKKKRKYFELEGETDNEMTSDFIRTHQPRISGEHHMISVEDNGRVFSIYKEFVNFQNKISNMTDDDIFGSPTDTVIEP